jgi:hyperosmotically inducible protein
MVCTLLKRSTAVLRNPSGEDKEVSMKSFLIFCILSILAAGPVAAGQPDADNSEKNVRDRGGDTVTPMEQGGSAADREVTAAIRRAIVDDDSLSTNAQNVKIVTVDGVVTLRGPVKSAAEKAMVAAKAEKTKGVKRIENQLEVEAN